MSLHQPERVVPACRYVHCTEPATRVLERPAAMPDQPPLRGRYCDWHLEDILSDELCFPGAREVTS